MGELLNCNPLYLQLPESIRTKIESREFFPITADSSKDELAHPNELPLLLRRSICMEHN
jgi:hypothetical protein